MLNNIRVLQITFKYPGDNNYALLVRYLIDSVDIQGFWNYVPFVFCVKTKITVSELTLKIGPFFPEGILLISEIDPVSVNGLLPEKAWTWFYEQPLAPGNRPANTSVAEILEGLRLPPYKK